MRKPKKVATIGGPVDRVKVSLTIWGDDLDPDDLTRRLRCQPNESLRKGEAYFSVGMWKYARWGSWTLRSATPESDDLGAQVEALLARVSDDADVWQDLGARFKMDIFCGLFLDDFNRGFELSAALLQALAARGLRIGFDIYASPPRPYILRALRRLGVSYR